MRKANLYLAAAVVLAAMPGQGQQGQLPKNRNLNISTSGDAESCADLKVTSGGEVAQKAEKFDLRRGDAAVVEISAESKGIIKVRGWDRAEFSVEACKLAAAENRTSAEQLVQGINVSRSAGKFTYTGPSGDSGQWQVYFIVHAPKDGSVSLEATNGPISVADMKGMVKVKAVNGPLSLSNVTGWVDAQAQNGPISYSGNGGEVHLTTHNGPISVRLSGDYWNGAQLEARAANGPVSLTLPDTFQSGVRLEGTEHSPLSCQAAACRNAFTSSEDGKRVMQFNGTNGTVRVFTDSGPVSVNSGKKKDKAL